MVPRSQEYGGSRRPLPIRHEVTRWAGQSQEAGQAGDHPRGGENAHSANYTAFGKAVYGPVPPHQEAYAANHGEDDGDAAAEEEPQPETGAAATSFRGKVNPATAAVVKKIHQNLGHPANRELVRHLNLSGASPAREGNA